MVEVMAAGLALLFLLAALGLFQLVAFAAMFIFYRFFGVKSPKLAGFLGAGLLPGILVAGFVVLLVSIDENFRGPEILGLGMVLALTVFAVCVAWPLNWWLNCRFFRSR